MLKAERRVVRVVLYFNFKVVVIIILTYFAYNYKLYVRKRTSGIRKKVIIVIFSSRTLVTTL